ncbi:MAG: hypothetical protein RJQ09_13235 [Cyclobacteriaceae bacterium]
MKSLTVLGLLLVAIVDFNDIAKINTLKGEAEEAYLAKEFDVAFHKYQLLVDSFNVKDDKLLLNYANAGFFMTGLGGQQIQEGKAIDTEGNFAEVSMSNYSKLTAASDKQVRSAANNQLGIMNYMMGQGTPDGKKLMTESLAYFKQSLKSNPANDNARYNYELVKKKLQDQQDQENQDQNEDQDQEEEKNEDQENQDQQNQDQQNEDQEQEQNQDQENQDQENQENQEQQEGEDQEGEEEEQQEQQQENQEEGEESEEKNQPAPEKLKEMNISEEMAKMILEAMRNNEVQYIQQQKRKPTKKSDSKKPDW